jgi:hypothetical protein
MAGEIFEFLLTAQSPTSLVKSATALRNHFEEARRLSNNSKVYLGFWAYACGLLGQPEEARRALERLLSVPSHEYVPSYFVALIHLGLHQADECIEWLHRACDERSHWVLLLNSDPIFDGIRTGVSFQQLLDKAGFNRHSSVIHG